ncbi:MAG: hypothetical protein ACR2NR_09380 [Solirubrobacteraceae bacterium]
MIAAIGGSSAVAATTGTGSSTGTTKSVSGPLTPLACNPKNHVPWTFEASNNYAAPNPGQRFTKQADGCQNVFLVSSQSAEFEVYANGNLQQATFCTAGSSCNVWTGAPNGVPFYISDSSHIQLSANIYF